MKRRSAATAAPGPAWDRVELVVFDVDGTLYHAGRLRALMAAWLAVHALGQGSLATPRRLAAFRRIREQLAQAQPANFLTVQYLLAAQDTGCSASSLYALVQDWMEQRPLRLLRACTRPGVHALFARLQQRGVRVAVLSDYPARAKLAAMGLRADPVVWAGDPGVGRLKPDPQGLLQILAQTGVPASRAVMVGDRLDRDGLAARRAGMAAVILGRPARAWPGAHGECRWDIEGEAARRPPPTYWARGFDDAAFAPLFDEARA